MAGIGIQTTVQYRNQLGRFERLCDEAGAKSARAMVDFVAREAHSAAPVGPARGDYGRRPKLTSSISGVMTSSKAGVVRAETPHAGPQEMGAGPHPIPNAFGSGQTVMHPGNGPQPYLRPAIAKLAGRTFGILKRYYPV